MSALLLKEQQPSSIYEEMHSNDMVVVTLKPFHVFCHRLILHKYERVHTFTYKQSSQQSP